MLAKFDSRLYLCDVSKQRPSNIAPRKNAGSLQNPGNGFNAAYWRRRLFKNTFTRNGQRQALKAWSVKIQHQGRRRTYSLTATNRDTAAREAWRIYRKLVSVDHDAVPRDRTRPDAAAVSVPHNKPRETLTVRDAADWKPRLLHRAYLEFPDGKATSEFSVRVEHAGTSQYFRLGTSNETRGAALAARIHRTVIRQGWQAANEQFRRELTLAVRWSDDPVAWTYTTIHTPGPGLRAQPSAAEVNLHPRLNLALIEADTGIRQALADCVQGQLGFCHVTPVATLSQALQTLDHQPIHIILANHSLAKIQGALSLDRLKLVTDCRVALYYSVYEDSDQLFTSVPGGVTGYLLKRTPPSQILEPVVEALGKMDFTSADLAVSVQQYFRRVLLASPGDVRAPDMAQLTHREHEVLALLSKGYLDKEIAESLHISIWTVHGHVKNIFEKLNVHSRTGAVAKFLKK